MASKDFMIPFMRGFVNEDYVEIDRNLSLLEDSCPINKKIREIRSEHNWENKISMVIGERINSLINTYECTDDIQSLFFDFTQTFIETAQFLNQERFAQALDKYVDCFKDFARLYKILSRNYRSDWLFQIFDRFYSNLRKIAIKANDQERKRGNNKEHLELILDALNSNRQEMNRLKTGDTLNHKIKVLILIEVHADAINYKLCNFKTVKDGIYNVATLIQSNNFNLSSLTKSLHVRLCYNWGKIALLTGRIPVAIQRLQEALRLVSKRHDSGNIKLILRYLAVAKVLNGQKNQKEVDGHF
jgi:tetratricopeptide (TPR) repeat protein